ncbi:MAG: hypothetical protein HUJ56_05130, partial [Erysipelotrichaceae bacterium]|nr:hypothetical protein [Erysipelotrichaceae bacterium]
NGNTVELKDKSEAEARLDNIANLIKGDVSELRNIIAMQPKNKVRVLFGVKTTDDNKQYQTVYTKRFLKNNNTNYSHLDRDVADSKANGAYSNVEFYVGDLKEYTVEPTSFEAPGTDTKLPFDFG